MVSITARIFGAASAYTPDALAMNPSQSVPPSRTARGHHARSSISTSCLRRMRSLLRSNHEDHVVERRWPSRHRIGVVAIVVRPLRADEGRLYLEIVNRAIRGLAVT